jgi:DNA-binding CsgD family transcriptional regulator
LSDVLLSDADQLALQYLLAAEPVAGRPLPAQDVLERLLSLLRCDTIGATVTDRDGYVVDRVELHHQRAEACSDSLSVGFHQGCDRAVEVWWERRKGDFSPRDVAVLTMIAPAVERLVRDASCLVLPASLTVQERRTLMLVAAGLPNREIARRLGVATCTVRKHLEHAYRKLGVANRLAAAVAFRGEPLG